jgi:hypothetical protein
VAVWVCANPSHKDVDAPLAVHGTGPSVAWHKEASRLYESARKKLDGFLDKEQDNAVKNLDAKDLGETHLQVTMMARGGIWLQLWGEPAGYDLELRANAMHSHLIRLIGAAQAFPATQKYINSFREFIARTGPARTKALANIEKLCNEQKWPAAEEHLFKVYDTLEPGTVFLSIQENEAIYKPFTQVDVAIQNAMLEMRSKAAEEELAKAVQELTPDFSALRTEIHSAVESVAATGSASWRGESLTGPQLVEKIAQVWQESQVRALRARAKKWALTFRTGKRENSIAFDPDNPAADDRITNAFAGFSDEVVKLLTRLIEADGTRATSESARTVFVDYLRVLAPLVRQTNQRAWSTQLDGALGKFSGKDPGFGQEIQSYAAATADLLRWRARVAAARSARKLVEFTPLEEQFQAGTRSGKVKDIDYTGLFLAEAVGISQPQLLSNSTDIMPVAVGRLVGQKTTVRNVARISAESKTAIVRYSQRTYAIVPAPIEMAGELAALKTDLMVGEQAPPLTLAAMEAVLSAERGDLAAAGGEITGMHLEGVITRFATLPTSAVVLTELGRLPPERFDGGPLHNMLMRFDVTPRWAAHDYFFLQLGPPANLTATIVEGGRTPRW